jgi:hypothetical protein
MGGEHRLRKTQLQNWTILTADTRVEDNRVPDPIRELSRPQGHIYLPKLLLNVVLLDQMPDDNAEKPPITALSGGRPERASVFLAGSVRN